MGAASTNGSRVIYGIGLNRVGLTLAVVVLILCDWRYARGRKDLVELLLGPSRQNMFQAIERLH